MKRLKRAIVAITLFSLIAYGASRLYFHLTGGFRVVHISSDFTPDSRWDTRTLTSEEDKQIDLVLSQRFSYLGKGCQSYVFLSEDGEYVIKFFKYQRFRPQFYNYWLTFIPSFDAYLQNKLVIKQQKLDTLYASWKLAFDELPEETGLVYVHLNKTDYLNKTLTVTDKIGRTHQLDMDQKEFLVQKSATMLCSTLDQLMAKGEEQEAKEMLSRLLSMILHEYHHGLADKDHALMQNTGVINGKAAHIDVGQFEQNDAMRHSETYHQELFNKYYKFRLWLDQNHPSLLAHVNQELQDEMGNNFFTINYIPKLH